MRQVGVRGPVGEQHQQAALGDGVPTRSPRWARTATLRRPLGVREPTRSGGGYRGEGGIFGHLRGIIRSENVGIRVPLQHTPAPSAGAGQGLAVRSRRQCRALGPDRHQSPRRPGGCRRRRAVSPAPPKHNGQPTDRSRDRRSGVGPKPLQATAAKSRGREPRSKSPGITSGRCVLVRRQAGWTGSCVIRGGVSPPWSRQRRAWR